jgi:hypothetical protein
VAAHQLAKEAAVMERSVYIPNYGKIAVTEEAKEFSEGGFSYGDNTSAGQWGRIHRKYHKVDGFGIVREVF